MSNSKKVIFISHITEETELAQLLKEEIINRTMGFVDVFVSSDGESIEVGKEWLDTIKNNLTNAEMLIVLCSQESVKRPWVNFEIGVGWAKGVYVIPSCHTDLTPGGLVPPVSMLQGLNLSSSEGLEALFKKIAQVTGADERIFLSKDFTELLEKIQGLELKYGFSSKVNGLLSKVFKSLPEIKDFVLGGSYMSTHQTNVSHTGLSRVKDELDELKNMEILSIEFGDYGFLDIHGEFINRVKIQLLTRISETDFSGF